MNGTSDIDPPPPSLFHVDAAVEGEIAHLAVFGDIDVGTVGILADRMRATIDEHRPAHVLLDLRESTFMDSLGLRTVLWLQQVAKDGGFRLTIVRGPVAVQRTLEITGLDRVLEIVDDPAQALHRVKRD